MRRGKRPAAIEGANAQRGELALRFGKQLGPFACLIAAEGGQPEPASDLVLISVCRLR